MISKKVTAQAMLSSLWIFILFNMIFRDLHEFLNEGFIEKIMAQTVSEEALLLYGFVLEIPIMMVLLSRVLKDTANKWVNIIAASITMLGLLTTLPSGDLDDLFFGLINSVAFLTIILIAWKLPSKKTMPA